MLTSSKAWFRNIGEAKMFLDLDIPVQAVSEHNLLQYLP